MTKKVYGFSLVEAVLITSVVLILSAVIVSRIGQTRQSAIQAKNGANATMLQLAYERAKLQHPEILSNNTDNISAFALDALNVGLVSKMLGSQELKAISLATNTTIAGNNAVFIAEGSTNSMAGDVVVPPTVAITSPTNGQSFEAGTSITLGVNASAPQSTIVKVEYYVNGNLFLTKTAGPWSTTLSPSPGTAKIMVKVINADGIIAASTIDINVSENTPPSVILTSPTSGTYPYTTTLSLSAVASDPSPAGSISKVEFYNATALVGTDVNSPYTMNWTPGRGVYDIYARAYDNLNAASESSHAYVTLEDLPPSVSFLSPNSGDTFVVGQPISVSVSATDDGRVSALNLFSGGVSLLSLTGASTTLTATTNVTASNQSSFTAIATDEGGQSISNTVSVSVIANPPSTITFTAPAQASEGQNVALGVSASDPQGVTTLQPRMDGTSWGIYAGSTFATNWVATGRSNHVFSAIATDSYGQKTTNSTTISVISNQPPVVVAFYPVNTNLTASVATQLGFAFSDPENDSISFSATIDGTAWASGGLGSVGYTNSWTPSCSMAGHTVAVTVTDSRGNSKTYSKLYLAATPGTWAIDEPGAIYAGVSKTIGASGTSYGCSSSSYGWTTADFYIDDVYLATGNNVMVNTSVTWPNPTLGTHVIKAVCHDGKYEPVATRTVNVVGTLQLSNAGPAFISTIKQWRDINMGSLGYVIFAADAATNYNTGFAAKTSDPFNYSRSGGISSRVSKPSWLNWTDKSYSQSTYYNIFGSWQDPMPGWTIIQNPVSPTQYIEPGYAGVTKTTGPAGTLVDIFTLTGTTGCPSSFTLRLFSSGALAWECPSQIKIIPSRGSPLTFNWSEGTHMYSVKVTNFAYGDTLTIQGALVYCAGGNDYRALLFGMMFDP